MRIIVIVLIFTAFTLSALPRSGDVVFAQNLVKLTMTHTHDLEEPDDHDHEHKPTHSNRHSHDQHEQKTASSQESHHEHSHELVIAVAQPVVLFNKVVLHPIEFESFKYSLNFDQGPLLDRPLDSLFRPPISV